MLTYEICYNVYNSGNVKKKAIQELLTSDEVETD